MRVLHVITGLSDGGAEAVLYRLVANDRNDVHHVVSLTGEGKYASLLQDVGASVTVLGMSAGRVSFVGLWRLWRVISDFQADILQTWMYHADLLGGLVGRIAGLPVVWGIHHAALDKEKESRITILTARLCALLSRRLPHRIVSCAISAANVHVSFGYDALKMVVVPNGVDLSRYYPDAIARQQLRMDWNLSENMPLIGMVARFNPVKDHANMVNALAILKQQGIAFRAVFVGMGMDGQNEEILKLIKSAGLDDIIELLGPRSDIPAVMNALDLNVLSSYSESFGNVLAEAMACGTPCVTTNVGDGVLVVDKTGWIVPPRDVGQLAIAMGSALQAWAEKSSWLWRQQQCRQRINDRFAIKAMVSRYRDVWAEVASPSVR